MASIINFGFSGVLSAGATARVLRANETTPVISAGVTVTRNHVYTDYHMVTVDPNASPDYESGYDYNIVGHAGTLNGVTFAGVALGHFTLDNQNPNAVLSGTGLDGIEVEAGITLPQAIQAIAAILAGLKTRDAETGENVFQGIGGAEERVRGLEDATGNRTNITLSLE